MKVLVLLTILMQSLSLIAQVHDRKGNIYGLWGYNRSVYAQSDIRFSGLNYDFIAYDVKAADFPSEFDPKTRFGINTFSIPQYNYRLGYFITNSISISAGLDHMKYVVKNSQEVLVDGFVGEGYGAYSGTYNDRLVPLNSSFFTLEHTDGLNYVSIEVDKHWLLWCHENNRHMLDWFAGGGLGIMVPRSDVTVFGEPAINVFHVAGEAVSLQTGFKATFFKHLYLVGTAKAGISRMHDILTTENGGRAQQNIGWFQGSWQVGYVGKLK
jgi:hypothetical protein